MSNRVKGKIKWSEETALVFLRSRNISITANKRIHILNNNYGLKALSAADYLKNNHYYSLVNC